RSVTGAEQEREERFDKRRVEVIDLFAGKASRLHGTRTAGSNIAINLCVVERSCQVSDFVREDAEERHNAADGVYGSTIQSHKAFADGVTGIIELQAPKLTKNATTAGNRTIVVEDNRILERRAAGTGNQSDICRRDVYRLPSIGIEDRSGVGKP